MSGALLARIEEAIRAGGGWIPFERYMHLALHEPGIGYYASGTRQLGAAGDFVTAPELGALFGRTLARQLKAIGGPILEIGAGSGALAAVLTAELGVPYYILETSAALRSLQRDRLGKAVSFVERLPERFSGAVIANEVVDAMPVHALAWTAQGIMERGVALEGGLGWRNRPASGALLEAAQALRIEPPYESEINLLARAWMRSLAAMLERGLILVIDYGFPRSEYYHPQRAAGTLMCHHRHQAHADPFRRPGAEDLTAHVDFSALAEAGVDAGLAMLGYTTQAQFLINCGITDVLGEANLESALHYAPLAAQAQRLLSPAEMGELFKVLALGRGLPQPLLGFTRGDRSHTL
jgi:SAM-dependent MidA family methyltransferase